MTGIDARLDEPFRGYAIDAETDSATLLVYFGGFRPGETVPRYDWIGVSRTFPSRRLYLRDHDQAWYHRGIRGLGGSIAAAARGLDGLIRELEPTRVGFVGNSFGGYGAILFGALLGVDFVQTVSPQAFVSHAARARHGEGRWSDEMARVNAVGAVDLKPFLGALGVALPRTVVHYAVDDACDVAHAEELGSLPGVELRAYPEGGHFLVRVLKEAGALPALLAEAAGAPAAAAA